MCIRDRRSTALKSVISSANETGNALNPVFDTTYNALAASDDMKNKVTIANVDNW